ncbi:MAG: hypothetical protein EOO66_31890, partial [Methylobacterium sp.]
MLGRDPLVAGQELAVEHHLVEGVAVDRQVERLAPTDVPQVSRDAKLALGSVYELGFPEILLNPAKAGSPLADPKVRQALDLSIDRNALNQVVFNGEFLPGNQWVSPKH